MQYDTVLAVKKEQREFLSTDMRKFPEGTVRRKGKVRENL